MAYTKKPYAEARRAELDALLRAGLAALHAGREPTLEQGEAIRNAYRTARRAAREGVRRANTAAQVARLQQIVDARAAFAAAVAEAATPTPAAVVALPLHIDPFTGAPLALPENFVL